MGAALPQPWALCAFPSTFLCVFFPYFVWGKRMGFWFLKQVVGAAGMEQN